jgi:6-pyruvoyl-tetrahydropterin synthase
MDFVLNEKGMFLDLINVSSLIAKFHSIFNFSCLPKVDSYDTEFTLKKCMRSTKWKKEAGELCSCSVNAGVR